MEFDSRQSLFKPSPKHFIIAVLTEETVWKSGRFNKFNKRGINNSEEFGEPVLY